MRGGSKRFVAIESKSFDFEVVGFKEDVLRIYENGRGRRFSLLLPEKVSLWLLRAWGRFGKFNSSFRCNQCVWDLAVFFWNPKGVSRQVLATFCCQER